MLKSEEDLELWLSTPVARPASGLKKKKKKKQKHH